MVLFMVGVIVYKLLVIHPLYKNPNFQEYAATIVSVTGSIMNLIIIMILSKVGLQGQDSQSCPKPKMNLKYCFLTTD